MQHVLDELRSLCAISAVSGREDELIDEVVRRIEPSGAQLHVDRLGNVTATFPGSERSVCSILYFAHMDELGLIVKDIDPDGFLRVERIGGVPEKTLPGTFVDVHTLDGRDSKHGFFGCYSHHITPPEKKMVVPPIKDMYIDIGCESKKEVLALGIAVGSMVTYSLTFQRIGKHRLTAKALDNRMGVYILFRMVEYLVQNPPNATIHLCFSVQEEFTIRGCIPVFERLRPDAAVCLDITPAVDTPELRGQSGVALGKGPAILFFNFHGRGTLAGLIPNPKLTAFLEQTAKSLNIACQRDVALGVITDDAFTQTTGSEGVAMAHISVPLRYTHAPVETIDLRDLEHAAQLCCASAGLFSSALDLSRGLNRIIK